MTNVDPRPKRARWIFLGWVLVAFFYFTISWDYIRTSWNDGKLLEYMEDIVQRAGADSRGVNDVQDLVFAKARNLGLPVSAKEIVVLGSGPSLTIAVSYEAEIAVPIFERGAVRKRYEHKVQYKAPR